MSDQARISPALLGFYFSCALVAAGAAMFFFAHFVLTKEGYEPIPTVMKVLGGVFLGLGIPGAFFMLGRARRETGSAVD